jgi:hypothetical protein
MINDNSLVFSYKFKKQYSKCFSNIKIVDKDTIIGYFCKSEINQEKEISKAISKYIIHKSIDLFNTINGSHIDLSSISDEIQSSILINFQKLSDIFQNNKIQIYNIEFSF